ncbi:uncharacterized protein LOC128317070 [Pangasianodon hypophthalmus]|uniref:uncharacterized protein LOC128317070 n=1 Tax=Pangasianodon hypophthalmus TaxID=310915 RepID=UPI00230731F2|nr:uncharacterized protein LOC128317070 [Pangasianodon hypophthalmus]
MAESLSGSEDSQCCTFTLITFLRSPRYKSPCRWPWICLRRHLPRYTGILDDIHSEYGISGKIVRTTTTDSGSNLIKAFKVYGEQSQQELTGADSAEAVTLESEEDAEGVEVQDTCSILNTNSGLEYHLPEHQRCACHHLNLVATVDASKAEDSSEVYKKLPRSTFAKCQALYNKTSRSAINAEIVQEECKLQFIQPNHTRWNSVYSAAERVMRILKEQGEASLQNPVSMALNILESETNTQMGWLLPTIYLLESKFRKMEKMEASVKVCLPLIRALQQALQKRFGEFMEDPELVSAAILLPKFKTSWTDKAHIIKAGKMFLIFCQESWVHFAYPTCNWSTTVYGFVWS